jgi:plasmid maintenance system antidote protein VapI
MDAKLIKSLILSGTIKTFNDLFDHATAKEIAAAMGCSVTHVNTLRQGSGKVTLKDVINLSEAIGFKGWERVGELWVE